MPPLRLIFMGTPEFALPTLKALAESPHELLAVYTQPPRPAGRGQKERLSPVHEYAQGKGLHVLTPATLKTPETQQQFRDHQADAAIVAAYGLLLPPAILEATRMGCINVHPSLLPRWRGAAPIQRTVMAGDKETGVVIMQMDAGLDTGDMLLLKRFAVDENENAGMLHGRLAREAGPMVLETLEGLASKTIARTPQSQEGITYAKKITKEECRIDWKDKARLNLQKIRGLNPHPAACFVYNGEVIKIFDAQRVPSSAPAGTVTDHALTVACGEDALRLITVQRPGKKPMPVSEMLKGHPIPPGTVLE